ncbi:EAL domain-containing protein [Salinimonas marina]|uniref:EAL domain-containing protein n=2 Tax=Salinimonas marina TaxID=2785918 RepID=A0A7S9HET3_9ALTE|nr:EAL domain-containing protein [Salinimonas marina]
MADELLPVLMAASSGPVTATASMGGTKSTNRTTSPDMGSSAFFSADPIQAIMKRAAAYQHIVQARVYDGHKVLLHSQTGVAGHKYGLPKNDPYVLLLNSPSGTYHIDEQLIASRRIIQDGVTYGYLMIMNDINSPVTNSWRTLLWHVGPLVALSLLITIAIGLYWLNRLLTPLSSLSHFTHQLSQSTDYTRRFKTRSNGEVARLGQNVNMLLDTIEAELTINDEQNQTLIEQQQTMSRLANFDSLTGLPNRQFVMDNLRLELARAKRQSTDLALMFFDLDGFKGINDSLGHETGDLILIEVADRVSGMLRESDLVARLGGDEFIIVPDRDVTDVSLDNLAQRVIAAFEKPFHFRGLALTVGVSIGIARAIEADFELSQLMSNADLAMYRSKARGRGMATIFTNEMVETHKRKLSIANSIDQGIVNNEFVLFYQPKIDRNGQVIGFEALMRWEHPDFGLVLPGEFIPVAEQSGKISLLTRWAIEQSCADLSLLQSVMQHKFRVAINLSGHDLRHSELFDVIYQIFTEQQVNPEYIEFEVTESAYLENFESANKLFKRLSNMGCAVALDDFGTGYSSLSYLTQISIDTLKIDRQFVREISTCHRSRLVTGAIIDLAKRLSLTICAEGVEELSQWEYLLNHGCDHVQGYLFSKPLPLEKIALLPDYFDFGSSPRQRSEDGGKS